MDVELTAHLGATVPFYQQSFQYNPGALIPPLPGLTVQQTGAFRLDGRGGLAIGGGLSVSPFGPLGIEARIDVATVDLSTQGASFRVRVDLPSPLPDVNADTSLDPIVASVDPVKALSLNLRLATRGAIALVASGGVSYVPKLAASLTGRVALGVVGLDNRRSDVVITSVGLRAESAEASAKSRLGVNAGVAVGFRLGSRLGLLAEARFFHFPRQTLVWTRADTSLLSPLEETLLDGVQETLDPVRFDLSFFQVTGCVALRL